MLSLLNYVEVFSALETSLSEWEKVHSATSFQDYTLLVKPDKMKPSHFIHLMRINSLVEESHYLYQLMAPSIHSSSAHRSLAHDETCGLSSLLLKQSTDFEQILNSTREMWKLVDVSKRGNQMIFNGNGGFISVNL